MFPKGYRRPLRWPPQGYPRCYSFANVMPRPAPGVSHCHLVYRTRPRLEIATLVQLQTPFQPGIRGGCSRSEIAPSARRRKQGSGIVVDVERAGGCSTGPGCTMVSAVQRLECCTSRYPDFVSCPIACIVLTLVLVHL